MPRPAATEPGQSRYAALAAGLRQRIVAGEFGPGDALPNEQALAQAEGVALGTMRRALDLLAEQGLVQRVQGRGTFVRQGLAGAPMLRFFRFGQGPQQLPGSRILARHTRPLPAEPAQALGLPVGSPGLLIKRLRLLNQRPCLHETLWLPLPRCAALAEGDPALWGDLLYPLLAQRCGVLVHRAVETIGFGALAAAEARALGLPAGHPCAQVQRQAFDLAGQCVEWRRSLGDAQAFQYTVTLT